MRIGLFCYSATGNTLLACRYFANRIPQVEIVNLLQDNGRTISHFDIVGFACPTYYFSIPPIVKTIIEGVEQYALKPAFLLTTFGMMQGRGLKDLSVAVRRMGFSILESYALRMPENYPPFLLKGWTSSDAPNENEKLCFESFIGSIAEKIKLFESGKTIKRKAVSVGFLNSVLPKPSHNGIMKQFGRLCLDSQRCNSCGACRDSCAYGAIRFAEQPIFQRNLCRACFNCYNACPHKAISTTKVPDVYQYVGPSRVLKEKLL